MKRILAGNIINLAIGFLLLLGIATVTQVLATEYYTYQDANGKLVISNRPPPPGSKIIKQQDLLDPADNETAKSQESKPPAVAPPAKRTDKQ